MNDALTAIGLVLATAGIALIYPPAALIAGGAILLLIGIGGRA
jgi:hypothetical protein